VREPFGKFKLTSTRAGGETGECEYVRRETAITSAMTLVMAVRIEGLIGDD
jgi:hypothetical protein